MSTTIYTQAGATNTIIVEHRGRWFRLLITLTPVAVWWRNRIEISPPHPGYLERFDTPLNDMLIRGPLERLAIASEEAGK